MGRPRTVAGDDTAAVIAVRLPSAMLAAVDSYAADMNVTRSVAARDMIKHAIDAYAKLKKRKKKK